MKLNIAEVIPASAKLGISHLEHLPHHDSHRQITSIIMSIPLLGRLLRCNYSRPSSIISFAAPRASRSIPHSSLMQPRRTFTSSPPLEATYNQVLRGCRKAQRARKLTSPQLHNRPEMKGVCLKVGITKPKKPNSGERKTARVRLSSGKVITAYIPGEGTSGQDSGIFWEG